MRPALLIAIALLIAGCAAPQPGDTMTTVSSIASTSAPPAGTVLGQLFLHSDGQHTWMDNKPNAADVDTPMASVAARDATLRFPLEPAPSGTVTTSGLAFIQVIAAGPTVAGPTEIHVAVLVGGEKVATSVQRGADTAHLLMIPTTIAAGKEFAIEVCLCNVTAQTYMMDTSGGSTADVPGPSSSGHAASGVLPAGAVTARRNLNEWIAERTDATLLHIPAGNGKVVLQTVNGDVSESAGPGRVVASLWGRGDTEQQARDRLATLYVKFTLETSSGLDLEAIVSTVDRSQNAWSHLGGDLDLTLPGDLSLSDANLASTNGDITSHDLKVAHLETHTTNGGLDATGTFATWNGRTTNGEIVGKSALPSASGRIDLSTTNGAIDLVVAQDGNHAVDATARTTNGDVTLSFANSVAMGPQTDTSGHVRTKDYEKKATQTDIALATTNGDASAGDN